MEDNCWQPRDSNLNSKLGFSYTFSAPLLKEVYVNIRGFELDIT